METWTQIYAPLGSLGLSALVASLPIIFFFIALAVLRMKGHVAGTITVAIALAIAVLVYQMPVDMAFAAAGYGFFVRSVADCLDYCLLGVPIQSNGQNRAI